MKTLTREQLVQVFEGLSSIMPTAKHYINHLKNIEGSDLKIAEIVYTTFIQTSDFTKEVK